MKSILIIDNHISVCDLLRKFLSKNNFNVETSSSASLGLDFLQRMKFDLILLEYHLPNISGLEFLERIKKLAPSTGVIFMSRDATLKNAVDVIHRGALNFISKPLNPDELLEIVNKVEPKSPNNVAFSTQYQPDSIVLEP